MKISKSHSKLTLQQANEIRQKYSTGKYFHRELAEEYNVSMGTIVNVVKYRFYNDDNMCNL